MKRQNLIVILIILLIIFIGWRLKYNNSQQDSPTPAASPTPEVETSETVDIFKTPEHMKNPESHNLSLEIIGPEGETIFPAQARMYNAFIKGNAKYQIAQISCHWKFYLNEYNDEVLFEEMENKSVLSEGEKEICGFTDTFINKIGKLRVELTADLSTLAGDPLESLTAERSYTVTK